MSNPEELGKCENCPIRLANMAILSELSQNEYLGETKRRARTEAIQVGMRILMQVSNNCDGPEESMYGTGCSAESAYEEAMSIAGEMGLIDIDRIARKIRAKEITKEEKKPAPRTTRVSLSEILSSVNGRKGKKYEQ